MKKETMTEWQKKMHSPKEFTAALYSEDTLIALLPLLQKNKKLMEYMLEHSQITGILKKWFPRIILTAPIRTVDAFCTLATELIQTQHPKYPNITGECLKYIPNQGQQGDTRLDGMGWTLSIVEQPCGPGDIDIRGYWRACAYHDKKIFTLECTIKGYRDGVLWYEWHND